MPGNAQAHNGLGAAYGRMGLSAEAMHEYQEALHYNPRFAEAHFNLGVQYDIQGRLDEAIAECEAALRFDPNLIEAHCNLGVLYGRKGRVNDEIEQYRLALQLDPYDQDVRHNLGVTYWALGRLVEAERELRIAARQGYAPALRTLRQLQAASDGSKTGPTTSLGQAERGSPPAATALVSDDWDDGEDEYDEQEEDDETNASANLDVDLSRVLALTIPSQEFAQQCMELLTFDQYVIDGDAEQASERIHLQRCIEKLRPYTTETHPLAEILLTAHEAWAWGNVYERALDAEEDGLLGNIISWWHDDPGIIMLAVAADLRSLVLTGGYRIGVPYVKLVEPDHDVDLLAPWDILGMAKLEVVSRRADLWPQQPQSKPCALAAVWNSWLEPHYTLEWVIAAGHPGWSPLLWLNMGEGPALINPSSERLHAMALEAAQNDPRYEALTMHIADLLTAVVDRALGGRVDMQRFELHIKPLLFDHPWLGQKPCVPWSTGPTSLWLVR